MRRTKTYIAGDWDGDQDLIQQLYRWNNSGHWSLSFSDAHELTQSRDTSKPCSIKKSLAKRLDASKTFVLIVGEKTKSLTKGSCQFCTSYHLNRCYVGQSVVSRSFIEYECEKAVRDGLNIVVIYNYSSIRHDKCPEVLRDKGIHIPAFSLKEGVKKWNYLLIMSYLI